jgi:hypothetical protein
VSVQYQLNRLGVHRVEQTDLERPWVHSILDKLEKSDRAVAQEGLLIVL